MKYRLKAYGARYSVVFIKESKKLDDNSQHPISKIQTEEMVTRTLDSNIIFRTVAHSGKTEYQNINSSEKDRDFKYQVIKM